MSSMFSYQRSAPVSTRKAAMRDFTITVKRKHGHPACLITHRKSIQHQQTAEGQREVESSRCRRSSQTPGKCRFHPVCETGPQSAVVIVFYHKRKKKFVVKSATWHCNLIVLLSPSKGQWRNKQCWCRAGEIFADGRRGRRKDSCQKWMLREPLVLQTETQASTLHNNSTHAAYIHSDFTDIISRLHNYSFFKVFW